MEIRGKMSEYFDLEKVNPFEHAIRNGVVIYEREHEGRDTGAVIMDRGELNGKPIYWSVTYCPWYDKSAFAEFARKWGNGAKEYHDAYSELEEAMYDGPCGWGDYKIRPLVVAESEATETIFKAAGVGRGDLPEGAYVYIHRDSYCDELGDLFYKAQMAAREVVANHLVEIGQRDAEWLRGEVVDVDGNHIEIGGVYEELPDEK